MSINTKVIILNGTGGSGKDTFVGLCREVLGDKYWIYQTSMADAAKEIAKEYLDWNNNKKTEKDRKMLSDIKDAIDEYGDYSFKYVEDNISWIKSRTDKDLIIFIHSREPKDIKRLVEVYNAKTVCIMNPRIDDIISNHADRDVHTITYDYYISNAGNLEEYKRQAEYLMREIGCLE